MPNIYFTLSYRRGKVNAGTAISHASRRRNPIQHRQKTPVRKRRASCGPKPGADARRRKGEMVSNQGKDFGKFRAGKAAARLECAVRIAAKQPFLLAQHNRCATVCRDIGRILKRGDLFLYRLLVR